MSKFIEATIQGQQVTATSYNKMVATVESIDDVTTVLANYAAYLMLAHNGPSKLNDLMKMKAFRTDKTDVISAKGHKVIKYIQTFAPIIFFDKKTETFSFRRFTGKDAAEKKQAALGVFNMKGEKLEGYDFPMSFKQFEEYEKPKVEDAPKKAFNADRLEKMAEDAMEAILEGRFSIADDSTALDSLMRLQSAMVTLISERQAVKDKIAELDKMRVLELAKLKPSSRETAAH